jgi:DNA-binding transcriptional MocR family regulator
MNAEFAIPLQLFGLSKWLFILGGVFDTKLRQEAVISTIQFVLYCEYNYCVKEYLDDLFEQKKEGERREMIPSWIPRNVCATDGHRPRYQTLADVIEDGVRSGFIPAGKRLPTVRELAKELGVSDTTVAAAYKLLCRRGQVEGRVGSGTYVLAGSRDAAERVTPPRSARELVGQQLVSRSSPWRRRTLTGHAAHLRAAYPLALDCTSGRPDPTLFPLAQLQKAWQSAISKMTYDGLQYTGPHPLPFLTEQIIKLLHDDGVSVTDGDIAVGSSTQQLIMLALSVAGKVAGKEKLVVAVEEPGYPTILDSFERLGHQLVGIEVDQAGAVPVSLEKAIALGATVALLTPRAQNPTGASWTPERKSALANLIALHPEVIVVEDDYFAGVTTVRSGSLLVDERIEDRVIHIRSFSKSMAPDLRVAFAAAKPRMRTLLMEEKSFADGWTSHLTQLAIATALSDPETGVALCMASKAYADRRRAATSALVAGAGGLANVIPQGEGVNVWVKLSSEVRSSETIEQAAALGVLIAPGEPFFLRIGHNDVVRFNAGSAQGVDQAFEIGQILGRAIVRAAENSSGSFLLPHV